jgi:dTMP kinase
MDGYSVLVTHEPTNSGYGKVIRRHARTRRAHPAEEFALFIADRARHVAQVVTPALQCRRIVIADRYIFSTAAYQGMRGIDARLILDLNRTLFPDPDLAILIDVTPAEIARRIHKRKRTADIFDKQSMASGLREAFIGLRHEGLIVVNGESSPDTLLETVYTLVRGTLNTTNSISCRH